MAFIDAVLRGVGQVVFVNNAYTGLLCLLGVFVASPAQGGAALAGTVAGTGIALLLRADRAEVRAGLYGYNGCLVALALPQFLGGGAAVWALALAAAGLSSALLLVLRRRMGALPPLTAPFVLCSWAAIALARATGMAGADGARSVPVPPPLLDWAVVEGAFAGIAQVFLQSSPVAGAVIAAGLLVGSRPVLLLAATGALAGASVAALIGVPVEAVRAGLFGFNAVLAAIAIGAVFLRAGGASLALALAAAALMPPVQTACAAVMVAAGLPTMSLPFILMTWAMLSAARAVPAIRGAA